MSNVLGTGQITLFDVTDVIASPTEPSNPIEGTMWWNQSDSHLYVYTNGGWETSPDYAKYVQSRGENLITNGTGLLGDNTNFSQFTFDGTQVFAGGGSFFTDAQNSTRFNDELIPVDPSRKYKFSLMAKSSTGLGHNYFGVAPYDIDKNVISPYHFYGSTKPVTTLAQDLKVGDTQIFLTDSTGFIDNAFSEYSGHKHSILFWGYKNSFGYEYPVGTYSRRVFTGAWNDGAINRTTHVITLNKAFNVSNPDDPQGVFRAGHKVSPTQSGGSYSYMTASNVKVSNTGFESFTGTIQGFGTGANQFPQGCSYIKLLFLTNRSSSGGTAGDSLWLNNLNFTDITDLDSLETEIDGVSGTVTNIMETLGNMANDNLITFDERQVVKDKVTEIIGYVMADGTTNLPTSGALDNDARGGYYQIRKSATNAGISTSDSIYVDVETKYNSLRNYLNGLSPRPWDLSTANKDLNTSVTKSTYRDKWLQYYKAVEALAIATADKLKQNVEDVEVGGTNYVANGDFSVPLNESVWASYYGGSVVERVDISTEAPPHEFALYTKNTTDTNGGIFQPTIFDGAVANDLVGKDVTVSFWLKYQNIVEGSYEWRRGRFGELIVQGKKADGTYVYSYPRVLYAVGSDMTWKRYVGTSRIEIPSGAVSIERIMFKHGLESSTGEMWTTGVQVEIGNKATDYSRSPLDEQSRTVNTVFEVNRDKIVATVTGSEKFNNALVIGRDFTFNEGGEHWRYQHGGGIDQKLWEGDGITVVQDGNHGANALQVEGDLWAFYGTPIPINPEEVYKVKFRVRQTVNPTTAGLSKVYAGVACFDAGMNPMTASSFGSHRYCATDGAKTITVADGWQEFVGEISGEGDDGYGMFISGTRYAVPMFIVNYNGGDGTAVVDVCSLENISEYNSLATKFTSFEQTYTDDGIVRIISQSTTYQNDLASKADSNALGDLATKEELSTKEQELKKYADNAVGLIDLTDYATSQEVIETTEELTRKFSATGGQNLLKNSIGFADFDFWNVSYPLNISTIVNEELDVLGFGSGFQFQGNTNNEYSRIEQDVNVVSNVPYTISWYVKKTGSTDNVWIGLSDDNGSTYTYHTYSASETTNGFEPNYFTFTPTSTQVRVRIMAQTDCIVTGLMFSIGDVALQWSLATGEVYNTNIRLDITGIRVSQLEGSQEIGFTHITPDEFAGYYDTNGDGIFEKVFYLNQDETVTKKLRALEEITMGTIKIISIESSNYTGWAFVPITE